MRSRSRDGDADIAPSTMHEILTQTLSQPAKATVIAVVNAFVAVIVPQLALVAVIPSRVLAAIHARLAGGLGSLTQHAEHILRLLAIEVMSEGQVVRRVVAVSAGIPLSAVEALHFDVSLVMHASQIGQGVLLFYVWIDVVVGVCGDDGERAEGRFEVAGAEIVRIVIVDRWC